jgi:predicted transcriptional regulator
VPELFVDGYGRASYGSRVAGIAEHERQQEVLRLLDVDGRVSVADLVRRFGVTAVTIRKDLEVLERRHLLARVRGGAVPADGADEGAFETAHRRRRRSPAPPPRSCPTARRSRWTAAPPASTSRTNCAGGAA